MKAALSQARAEQIDSRHHRPESRFEIEAGGHHRGCQGEASHQVQYEKTLDGKQNSFLDRFVAKVDHRNRLWMGEEKEFAYANFRQQHNS